MAAIANSFPDTLNGVPVCLRGLPFKVRPVTRNLALLRRVSGAYCEPETEPRN